MAETHSDGRGDDLEYLLQTPEMGTAGEVPTMRKKKQKHKTLDLSYGSHDIGRWTRLLYSLGGQGLYTYRTL